MRGLRNYIVKSGGEIVLFDVQFKSSKELDFGDGKVINVYMLITSRAG